MSWVYFNRDYKSNERGDLVDIQDEEFVQDVLVKEKIAQVVDNPHQTYANIIKKRNLSSQVNLTKKSKK